MGLIQKAFGDIITFSRASNATRIGPTGRVEYAPHNLLQRSQEFDNAYWSKSDVVVTANAVSAPDGTVTADHLIETNVNALHRIVSASFSSGTYTFSVYAKAGARTRFEIATQPVDVGFDLSNGTILYGSGGSITSAGNGWYRCSVTCTTTSSSTFIYGLLNASSQRTYTGDGTSGIYLWGAQLSVGSVPGDYTPTTSAAVYGPRFDFDPVTLAARGLLIEEQRTNTCTYSEDIANAVWSATDATVSANAATSPDGTVSADSLTFTATDGKLIRTNPIGLITVSGSTTYTISVWLKVTSGTFKLKLSRTNAVSWASATVSPELTVTTDWQRFTLTYTSGAGDSLTDIILGSEAKTPYNMPATGTVLVWGVQHEAGSFATSYIPTVASSVTRSADVASVNTLSPWFNATGGTIYTEFDIIGKTSTFGMVSQIDDGTLNNRIVSIGQEAVSGGVRTGAFINQSGVSQMGEYPITSMTVGLVYKNALAFAENNCAVAVNGVSVVDGSVALPTGLTTLRLGSRISDGYLNGRLRRFAFYPRRLSVSELTALTA